jgi:L-amino acid N-acyltransferase YncA
VTLTVEAMTSEEWPSVRRMYQEGIATGDATLETEPPDQATWNDGHVPDRRSWGKQVVAMVG